MITWRATMLLLVVVVLVVVLAIAALSGSQRSCNTAGATLPTPPGGQLTGGQMLRYLESTGNSPNAAAGVVGNLVQESGLNPAQSDGAGGGGLAQWNSTWYHSHGPHGELSLDAFARVHGLQPATDQAQLMYLAYDLRSAYSSLLTQLNTAPDPGTAATMFETGYELCSGVTGIMQVQPGSLCMDPNRRAYAIAALGQAGGLTVGGASAIPVSLVTGTACAPSFVGGSGLNPIPGFRIGRDDMGVDACGTPGQPIIAPAPSTLVQVVADWYAGQPLLLFRFTPPLSGTLDGDQYWYLAEQIDPVTVQTATAVAARQVVAHYAASGSCIEIGWGSPTSNSRTLADVTDPGAANPPAGATTSWGESFKQYFGIR